MIRKISKKCDYRDIIKSCPSGVIDDIKSIFYFISGHPETEIEASFEKVGNFLEVILPISQLAELGNGVLMRRALYSTTDSDFPDGEYNLEFVDDMNVWLGDEEVDPPFDSGYLVESDLKTINNDTLVGQGNINLVTPSELSQAVSTLSSRIDDNMSSLQSWVSYNFVDNTEFNSAMSSYVSWVSSQVSDVVRFNTSPLPSNPVFQSVSSYIIIDSVPAYIGTSRTGLVFLGNEIDLFNNGVNYAMATTTWVDAMVNNTLSSYATQSWVQSQGYLTSVSISGYATESWVQSQGYLTSHQDLSSYATMSWVSDQGYLTSETIPSDIATQGWVSSNFLSATALSGYATESWVQSQGYLTSETIPSDIATQSWVQSQGYLTSETIPSDIATQSWVESQGYLTSETIPSDIATQSWVQSQGYLTSVPSEYATQSWVQSQGYLTSHQDLSSYATQSWVSSNFLSATALSGYATESWVQSQGYLTSHQDLSSYATQSWVSSNFLSTNALSGYATESWATSEFFEESKIWTGTQSQWDDLLPTEKALYTIALVEGDTSPVILYQTDGTSGLLGHNNNTYSTNWQLENLDLTPYSYIKCYFKAAATSDANAYTPAVQVVIDLDPAAMGTTIYTGGVMVALPFNRNREYMVTCAVDSTKTKFQVIHQNTLWDVSLSDANNNGRYLYKIEGYLK